MSFRDSVLFDLGLNPCQFIVCCFLKTQNQSVSYETIAQKCKMSNRQVLRVIKELSSRGIIQKISDNVWDVTIQEQNNH